MLLLRRSSNGPLGYTGMQTSLLPWSTGSTSICIVAPSIAARSGETITHAVAPTADDIDSTARKAAGLPSHGTTDGGPSDNVYGSKRRPGVSSRIASSAGAPAD